MSVEYDLPETKFSWDPEIDGVPEALPPIDRPSSQTELAKAVRTYLFDPEPTYPLGCPIYHLLDIPIDQMKSDDNDSGIDESKHKIMSVSDLELAQKARSLESEDLLSRIDSFLPSANEAKTAIKGTAGHTLTALVTDLERQVRDQNKIFSLTLHHPGLKDHERKIFEAAAEGVIADYRQIKVEDVSHIIGKIWEKVRTQYVFVKKTPNTKNKALKDGSKFPFSWVADQWYSLEQITFEEKLLATHEKRIIDLQNEDLFTPTDLVMALQSMPGVDLQIEKLAISQFNFGWYKIQFKGQKDYELSTTINGQKRYIRIDDKYGRSDNLFDPSNRMQALVYSSIAEKHKGSKHFREIYPQGMFLYRVFDVENLQYYYVDASVAPLEYQDILTNLRHHTLIWWFMHDDLKQIKFIKSQSMMMPHLPEEAELTRASQAAMLLV